MICLKICTFVASKTTFFSVIYRSRWLWFAWKSVPLWHQKQPVWSPKTTGCCCDLLENLYLCGIKNNMPYIDQRQEYVVICLKICTFVASKTTEDGDENPEIRCDLLENLYLCGIKNNLSRANAARKSVVICLKICTFVASKTTKRNILNGDMSLWFAWKSVPLWHQKQLQVLKGVIVNMLWFAWKSVPLWHQKQRSEKLYRGVWVVICLKICTFVASKTTR